MSRTYTFVQSQSALSWGFLGNPVIVFDYTIRPLKSHIRVFVYLKSPIYFKLRKVRDFAFSSLDLWRYAFYPRPFMRPIPYDPTAEYDCLITEPRGFTILISLVLIPYSVISFFWTLPLDHTRLPTMLDTLQFL